MLFLIDYDRRAGQLIEMRRFPDTELAQAFNARLQIELELYKSGIDREVVLFDASDEEQLRKTHGRYFKSIWETAQDLIESLEAKLCPNTPNAAG